MRYKIGQVLYRYKVDKYGKLDNNGEYDPTAPPDIKIGLTQWYIQEVQTDGYVIQVLGFSEKRYWISQVSLKRNTYKNKEDALNAIIKTIESKIEGFKRKEKVYSSAFCIAKSIKLLPFHPRRILCTVDASHPNINNGMSGLIDLDFEISDEGVYELLLQGSNTVSNYVLAQQAFADGGWTVHSYKVTKTVIISL